MSRLDDPQSAIATKQYPIKSVGITELNYPGSFRDGPTGQTQHTTAAWKMAVSLPAEKAGTHMSRFIAELQQRYKFPMTLNELGEFSEHIRQRLEAPSATIEAKFIWFREVKAPVSGMASMLDYRVTFSSTAVDGKKPASSLRVYVPAKSLCPCSKAISDRGAHNQRSYLDVCIDYAPGVSDFFSIDELLKLVERSASSPVYPLLKREDEKFVTETAYDNPVFVETLVRNVADRLVDLTDKAAIRIEAVNQESIHAHDCFAVIELPRR